MNISLVQGSSTLQLNGSGVSAPIKAARFADESLTELEVVCEGTAASIAGVTDSIGVKLFEAGRVWGLIGENQVYVQLTLPDGVTWRSPIKAGRGQFGARSGWAQGERAGAESLSGPRGVVGKGESAVLQPFERARFELRRWWSDGDKSQRCSS